MRTRNFALFVGLAALGACQLPEDGAVEETEAELVFGGCPKAPPVATKASPATGQDGQPMASEMDPGSDPNASADVAQTDVAEEGAAYPCKTKGTVCLEFDTVYNGKMAVGGICVPAPRTVAKPANCNAALACDCPGICEALEFCGPPAGSPEYAREFGTCFQPIPSKANPAQGPDGLAKGQPVTSPDECSAGVFTVTADSKKKAPKKDSKDDKKKTEKPDDKNAGKKGDEPPATDKTTEEEDPAGTDAEAGGSETTPKAGATPTGGSGGAGTTGKTPPPVVPFKGCFCPANSPKNSPCGVCQTAGCGLGKVCTIGGVTQGAKCIADPRKAATTGTPQTGTTTTGATPTTTTPMTTGTTPATGTGTTPATTTTPTTGGNTTMTTAATPAVVTYADVKSIFVGKCSSCHKAGGSGADAHTLADGFAGAKELADNPECAGQTKGKCALTRVKSGSMPLGKNCKPGDNGKTPGCLTTAEIMKLEAWVDGGILEK